MEIIMNPVLEVKNIKKAFGNNEVLKGIDFSILENERIAIVGGNGAGKTTLLNILSGNDNNFSGEIITDLTKEDISFQFQTANYPQDISLYELLNIFEKEENSRIRKKIIEEKLATVGLLEHEKKNTSEISGGQMQKLNLLLTMATGPKLVFFDEILSGLDKPSVDEIFLFFNKFIKGKFSTITVSHNPEEIFKTCTKVLFMVEGKFIKTKNISEYKNVANLEKDMKEYIIFNDLINYDSLFKQEDLFDDVVIKYDIKVKGIKKRYQDKYVLTGENNEGISFEVDSGSKLAIIGKNGSGKSTLVEIISGVKRKNKGEIIATEKFSNDETNLYKKYKTEIFGIQFQKQFYPSNLNLRDIIIFNLKANNIKYNEDYIKVILESVDLTQHVNNSSFEISGGQRQKLNIILTLLKRPSVLILDELTTGLDILAREKLTRLIKEYLDKSGATLIMVTHSAEDINNLSNDILLLKEGKILDKVSCKGKKRNDFENILRDI